jgi:hypothetical protein
MVMKTATSEIDLLRSKVAKQRIEIARLEQVVARLSLEKAELLLDVKMYKQALERNDAE